ncbi:hypothetical protein HU200_038267 [Digitaria exilis]|uniref:Uncharacterized protein n=1 Tax=Digitaria exilis TaxID=1010633 RepID=A0A835EIJ6_9POAL|nr:hypothetical protein HU200_038267 [Digitaria exilis]
MRPLGGAHPPTQKLQDVLVPDLAPELVALESLDSETMLGLDPIGLRLCLVEKGCIDADGAMHDCRVTPAHQTGFGRTSRPGIKNRAGPKPRVWVLPSAPPPRTCPPHFQKAKGDTPLSPPPPPLRFRLHHPFLLLGAALLSAAAAEEMAERLTRIAIVSEDKCKPKKAARRQDGRIPSPFLPSVVSDWGLGLDLELSPRPSGCLFVRGELDAG